MNVLQFLFHVLNFVAPAVCVGVLLAGGTALCWRKAQHLLPWYTVVGIHSVLGVLVLALGVVLLGHDGRMATYAVMVVSMATCQWLVGQGWRR